MISKKLRGRPAQLRTEVHKALKDERLTPRQRLEYILMLAELDGVEFKFKEGVKTLEDFPTEEDIFAKDSEKRIREALGVKEEPHDASTNESTSS
jgi:hypothetical protein